MRFLKMSSLCMQISPIIAEHRISFCVALANYFLNFALIAYNLGIRGGVIALTAPLSVAIPFCFLIMTTMGIQLFYQMITKFKPDSPLRFLAAHFYRFMRSGEQRFALVAICILFSICYSSFLIGKALIPTLNPFTWDPFFTDLDYRIHLSHYPHEFFAWITSSTILVYFMDWIYQSWLYAFCFSIFYVLYYFRGKPIAKTYFLSNCITWIIGGNLCACIFSSAGPIFTEYFSNNPDHIKQLNLIRSTFVHIPSFTLSLRHELWYYFKTTGYSSISAFPSMHVAGTTLMTIAAFNINKPKLAYFMIFYFILILLGSVILTWHYAVDGYVGALIAVLSWVLSKRLLSFSARRNINQPLQPLAKT